MFKNKSVVIIAIVTTLILAGIAVFTALRLNQQRNVAPNAPESEPGAAVDFSCKQRSLIITTAGPACNEQCSVDSDCSDGNTCVDNGSGTKVCRNPNCSEVTDCICVPNLPACNESCESDDECSGGTLCLDNGAGVNVCRNPECSEATDCTCTIPSSCSESCTEDSDCGSGNSCVDDGTGSLVCRNPLCTDAEDCTCTEATPTPTPTPTPPPSCNNTCTVDAECPSSMDCVSGSCRNPSCSSETDCICPEVTPTPTPVKTNPPVSQSTPEPSLPEAGVSTATYAGIGLGSILLIGALLLAF